MIFQSVSWVQYLICVSAFIFVYYIIFFVAVISFGEKKAAATSVSKTAAEVSNSVLQTSQAHFAANLKEKDQRDFLYPIVHDAVNELQAFLQTAGNSSSKQDIVRSLNEILKKYPTLRRGNFRASINNLIFVTCETHCSIRLSEDDLREVWDDDGASSRPLHNGGEVLESI